MFSRSHIIFFTTALFLLSFEINAQIIEGVVLDNETKEAVPFANVYFTASQHGTTTDQNGQFELNTDGYYGQNIVVSCVGYDTWIIEDFQDHKYYKVYLMPSSQLLREIVIAPNDMSRKKKERIFLREFLGASANASKCTIENIAINIDFAILSPYIVMTS